MSEHAEVKGEFLATHVSNRGAVLFFVFFSGVSSFGANLDHVLVCKGCVAAKWLPVCSSSRV